MNRRHFLKSAGFGLAAAFLEDNLARAAALPATGRSGTLEDVEHIVVFMLENRSFDHYFGHLSGVRGYNDRFAVRLPGGKPVWFQPRMQRPDEPILPFRLDTRSCSAQLLQSLNHSWASQHEAIAAGRMDAWPLNKTDMTMGYFLREDIPFHYALADAFTICDHYFCSIAGPTAPNRTMLWTGSIDPHGTGGGPFIDNDIWIYTDGVKPFAWTTYAERLRQAGITWHVYQEGLHQVDGDPMTGNYNCNALSYFKPFVDAPQGAELRQRALSAGGTARLRKDVIADRLPQVSWIVMPAGYSEHPYYPPAYGAMYIARVLEALTANPKVWGRTVLLLTYDENDGFFDHMVPPQPPTPVLPGISTVSTEGEVHDVVNPDQPTLYTADQLPYGLGPRVPMLVISPWSRGGYVCSEVFDHTSVIRLMEARFGVKEPNITPWRRAVCGDLTAAFDFASYGSRLSLPSTSGYRDMVHRQARLPPPVVPARQAVDVLAQERGTRPARALPYALSLSLAARHGGVRLRFDNRSTVGICCTSYWDGSFADPRRYTIGAGHRLEDLVRPPANQSLALSVYGPNGFLRKICGPGDCAVEVIDTTTPRGDMRLHLRNGGDRVLSAVVRDESYGQGERHLELAPGGRQDLIWSLQRSHHWYDLSITAGQHCWRLAGHIEDGHQSTSDPANVAPVLS
ncbi:MAG TPA: phospholipase C, phosphocholine-specific [Steroidobacteraceae bacterium]|nr:phospholipase C, phosphocholine-specific [Steroidobacteraceae bacterium]